MALGLQIFEQVQDFVADLVSREYLEEL